EIYVRSDGRVQFFTFGPTLQATLAGLSLIFLGWVAFATVNVIFKDRIISAKDNRYQQMQSAYENRVADLQTSYDDLNGALVSAEDRFKSSADELEAKQNTIFHLLGHSSTAPTVPVDPNAAGGDGDDVREGDTDGAGDSVDDTGNAATAAAGGSEIAISPKPVEAQPRTSKPVKASFLDLGVVDRLAGVLFGRK